MAFDTKTYDELVEIEKNEMRELIRTPEGDGPDLSVGSDFDIEARVHAAVVFGTEAHADYLAKQILPSSADGDFLIEHADLRGVSKRGAEAASGRIHIGLDGGSAPLVQPAGSTVRSLAGQEYTLDEDATVALPGWTGKEVMGGATLTRVQVLPHVNDMARGHRASFVGEGERTIVRVLPSIQSIEVDPPFEGNPGTGSAITPVASAFAAVTATSSGASTNQEPGVEGTLESPTAGLSADVEFIEMTGGRDAMTTDDLRPDVLSVMAVRPAAGNLEQWRRWTLDTPGLGLVEAFVYPGLRGFGTMTILPFGVSGARQIGAERLPEIVAYLRSQHAFDDDVEALQFSFLASPVDVELVVQVGRGYEPDADIGIGGGLPLHSSTPSTVGRLQLNVETDLDYWQVGDRVVVPLIVAGLPTTEEVKIVSITNAGAGDYQIDVTPDLSAVPALAEEIYSGGPLYATIRAALETYFDTLGPGDTVPPSRWPDSADVYAGDVLLKEMEAATTGVPGVRNHVTNQPLTDQVAPPLFVHRLGELRILWTTESL